MLSPRTVLNGGERGQVHARKAKEKIEDPPQDQPKWWLSGAVNLFGPYLYIFTLLWCNGGKRNILNQGEASPLELLDGPLSVPMVA